MFFVPQHVDATKGRFLVMTDHGTEGWGITSQHERAEDALLSLADVSYGRQMIVQITEFKFSVTPQ